MVQCGICLEEYQEGELELHQVMCVVRLVFRCTYCDEDYMSKEGLWNHLDLHKIADERKELHYHEIKARYKLHQCDLCNDQRAYSESSYSKHVQDIHDGNFQRCSLRGDIVRPEKLQSDHAQGHRMARDQTVSLGCEGIDIVFPIKVEEIHSDAVNLNLSQGTQQQSNALNEGQHQTDSIDIKMEISAEETAVVPCESMENSFTISDCPVESRVHPVSENYSAIECTKDQKQNSVENPECDKPLLDCSDDSGTTEMQAVDVVEAGMDNVKKSRVLNVDTSDGSSESQADSDKLPRNTFTCRHCDKKFNRAYAVSIHEPVCATRKFACDLCDHKFKFIHGVKQHKQRYHKINEPVKNTNSEFTEEQKKIRDEKINSTKSHADNPEIEPSSPCSLCDKTFANESSLRSHINLYHKPYPCKICGTMFASLSKAQYHRVMKHKEPKYKCPECPRTFLKPSKYRLHLAICKNKTFSCSLCNKKLKEPKSLIKHRKNCPQYKEAAKTAHNVQNTGSEGQNQKHLESIGVEKEITKNEANSNLVAFTCPICGEKFDNQQQVSGHVEATHQLTICTNCGMTFASAGDLIDHELTCSQQQPTKFTENNVRIHDQKLTSESCVIVQGVKEGQTENVELKLEFQEEDTVLQEQEYQMNGKEPLMVSVSALDGGSKKQIDSEKFSQLLVVNIPNRSFVCPICGMAFSKYVHLRNHKWTKHMEGKYPCPHCPMRCHHVDDLKAHEKKCAKRNFSCEVCSHRFKNRRGLNLHLERVHVIRESSGEKLAIQQTHGVNASNPLYVCNICKIAFSSICQVRYHKLTRHTEGKYQCPNCPKKFYRTQDFKSHEQNCVKKKLSCEVCSHRFRTMRGLNEHIKHYHVGESSGKKSAIQPACYLTCPHCKKQFSDKKGLRSHINQGHAPRRCDICRITFANYHRMRRHKDAAHIDTNPKCAHCSKTFVVKEYEAHVSVCEKRKYSCETCGKKFQSRSYTAKHKRIHHQDNHVKATDQLTKHKDTYAQQQSTKAVDSESNTAAIVLPQGEYSSSKSNEAVHDLNEVQINSMNMSQEDNIELKIEVEDTMLQGQEFQALNEDQEKSCTTTSVTMNHLEVSKHQPLPNEIKIEVECQKHVKESLNAPQSTMKPLKSRRIPRDRKDSLKHPEADDQLHPCPICGRTFTSSHKMKYHMVVAHTEPRHTCPHCPWKFHSLYKLRRHEKTHGTIVSESSKK